MLQIHFTHDDLGHVRLSPVPDMMWEAVSAVQLLQNREGQLIFDAWRRKVRQDIRRTPAEASTRVFATLSPHAKYFPDFLTPESPTGEIGTSIDQVLSTSRQQLHEEVTRLDGERPLPHWARGLAAGEPDALRRFGGAIHDFHDVAIRPYLSQLEAELNAEHTRRAGVVAGGGANALLDSFRPLMIWTPPVLNVHYPIERQLHLDGRGLRIVPSFFCWSCPVALADPALQPTLVYPIRHSPGWLRPGHSGRPGKGGLTALIGSTRAAILQAMASGCTTTQVARLIGISPATATHHANVLRDASLITSHRDANTVLHTATPLGLSLLNSTSGWAR